MIVFNLNCHHLTNSIKQIVIFTREYFIFFTQNPSIGGTLKRKESYQVVILKKVFKGGGLEKS